MGVFLAKFLRNPRSIGAIAPSSRFLARKMLEDVEMTSGMRVVEFGPGTGALTKQILDVLPVDGQLLAIEREPVFVRMLTQRFPRGDFVLNTVAHVREIADTRGLLPIDHIISGLPFASLPEALTLDILDSVEEVLRPGGTFHTFQYLHAYHFTSARTFRERMNDRFGPVRRCCTEWRNIPPAYVFTWQKPSSSRKEPLERSHRNLSDAASPCHLVDRLRPESEVVQVVGQNRSRLDRSLIPDLSSMKLG